MGSANGLGWLAQPWIPSEGIPGATAQPLSRRSVKTWHSTETGNWLRIQRRLSESICLPEQAPLWSCARPPTHGRRIRAHHGRPWTLSARPAKP